MTDKKVALVTGSNRGIGLEIAHGLARDGMNIILHGPKDTDDTRDLESRFKKEHNVEARYLFADFLDTSQVARLADKALQTWGQIDVLVNNVGAKHVDPDRKLSI